MKTPLNLQNAKLAALSADSKRLNTDLLKLRAVIILLATPHGSKAESVRTIVSELQGELKLSARSLYRWQASYRRAGFAGIGRRRRGNRGQPQGFSGAVLLLIAAAARRICRYGDLAREFRNDYFQDTMTAETFRSWVRRFQHQVIEISKTRRREKSIA